MIVNKKNVFHLQQIAVAELDEPEGWVDMDLLDKNERYKSQSTEEYLIGLGWASMHSFYSFAIIFSCSLE